MNIDQSTNARARSPRPRSSTLVDKEKIMKIVAGLLIAAGAAVGLAPVAAAGPSMSCMAALDWQAHHNAMGGNVDTSSNAAVDSYNAEADAIDAQISASCGYTPPRSWS